MDAQALRAAARRLDTECAYLLLSESTAWKDDNDQSNFAFRFKAPQWPQYQQVVITFSRPVSVNEIPGAIPQIVNLGEAQPAGDYFVAYTTAPQVLSPIKKKLKGRVLLFVKEKRLPYYKRVYRKYPHVELRPTTPDFAEYLARSKGLIASR